jgi:uncharacterized membrane protein
MRLPRTFESRLFWSYVGYVLLSVFVFAVSDRFEHFFFAINLTLAMVPLWLATRLSREVKKPWMWWTIALAVVAFFPNAFYLFTDFIHLGGTFFFFRADPYVPVEYVREWVDWLRVVHIALGAVIGGLAGICAYARFKQTIRSKAPRLVRFLPAMLLLSAVGIYIGRFLRFNSWDLLFRPWAVLAGVWNDLDGFAFLFILFFFLLQWALIVILAPLFEHPKKEDTA